MLEAELNINELDKLTKKIFNKIERDMPKQTDKFMKSEGKKFQRKTISTAKKATKQKTSNYIKSIKGGKPYEYMANTKSVRVYSYAPHAHLIEDGHVLVKGGKKGKGGKEIGFVKGKKVFEKSKNDFEAQFISDCEKFVDDILDKF